MEEQLSKAKLRKKLLDELPISDEQRALIMLKMLNPTKYWIYTFFLLVSTLVLVYAAAYLLSSMAGFPFWNCFAMFFVLRFLFT